jgi:hypothetical protein
VDRKKLKFDGEIPLETVSGDSSIDRGIGPDRSFTTEKGNGAALEIKEQKAIMDHVRSLPIKNAGELLLSRSASAPEKSARLNWSGWCQVLAVASPSNPHNEKCRKTTVFRKRR